MARIKVAAPEQTAPWLAHAEARLIAEGLSVHRIPIAQMNILAAPLPTGEQWLQRLSSNARKNAKKFLKRAQESQVTFTITDQFSDALMDRFIRHHLAYWEDKGGSFLVQPHEVGFLRTLTEQLNTTGEGLMATLAFEGQPMFDLMLLHNGQALHTFMIAQAPNHAYSACCPGAIIYPFLLDWLHNNPTPLPGDHTLTNPTTAPMVLAYGAPTEWVERTATAQWPIEEWLILNPRCSLQVKSTFRLFKNHLIDIGQARMGVRLVKGHGSPAPT